MIFDNIFKKSMFLLKLFSKKFVSKSILNSTDKFNNPSNYDLVEENLNEMDLLPPEMTNLRIVGNVYSIKSKTK